ncbi:ankyrin repeat domain-containing protein [Halanaerobacter jeridensis]|uniref:Ankyrin repeat protein n=1 Tax=Halanaerobacter jeridensis TaxID=706427 RepID=A0A938XQ96_9FIRM|nr:ankyrin repeat domain-containing protein [Halanaerobacter jeridensis]MBM7555584.1 ankyrin repeat protein [Halanaerobacter jeridensis]
MKKNNKLLLLFLFIYLFTFSNSILAAPIGWRFCSYEQAKNSIKRIRDINIQDQNGKTPLMWAAGYNKDYKVTALLIQQGAEVNLKDDNGLTALLYAVKNGNKPSVVKELLDAGANINYQSPSGNTALIWAAKNNNLELAKILIEAKAETDIHNNQNKTAVDISKANNNSELKKVLLDVNKTKNDKAKENNPQSNKQLEIIKDKPKQSKQPKPQEPKKNKQKNKTTPFKKRSTFYDGVSYNSYSFNNNELNLQSSSQGLGGFVGYKYYLKRNMALGVELEYLQDALQNNYSSISFTNLFLIFDYHFFFAGAGINYTLSTNSKNAGLGFKTGLRLEKEINNRLNLSTSLIYRQIQNEIYATEINFSSYGLQGGFNIKF